MPDSSGREGGGRRARGRTAARLAPAPRGRSRALRPVLDSISEGVAVADANGVLLLFNRAAERILGIGAVAAPPERWSLWRPFSPPDRSPEARRMIR